MAVPKKRVHSHTSRTPKIQKGLLSSKIVPVAIVIFMLFGAGFAYLTVGYDPSWLVGGAVIGGGAGFLFGLLVAKQLAKK
jgi:hypothetical protein